MAALSIQVPYPVFYDRDGQPLDNGNIYIGITNLDPITYPLQVYFDEALTIPASQPLKTSNGYIYRNGTPTQLYVDAANFSILVNDSKNTLVYSFPDGTGIDPNASGITYNEGSTGAVDRTVESRLQDYVSVRDFGAVGDGVTDDTAAINAAADAARAGSKALNIPAVSSFYLVSDTIDFSGLNVVDGKGAEIRGTFGAIPAVIIGDGVRDGYFWIEVRNATDKSITAGNQGICVKPMNMSKLWLYVRGFNDGIYFDGAATSGAWVANEFNIIDLYNNGSQVHFDLAQSSYAVDNQFIGGGYYLGTNQKVDARGTFKVTLGGSAQIGQNIVINPEIGIDGGSAHANHGALVYATLDTSSANTALFFQNTRIETYGSWADPANMIKVPTVTSGQMNISAEFVSTDFPGQNFLVSIPEAKTISVDLRYIGGSSAGASRMPVRITPPYCLPYQSQNLIWAPGRIIYDASTGYNVPVETLSTGVANRTDRALGDGKVVLSTTTNSIGLIYNKGTDQPAFIRIPDENQMMAIICFDANGNVLGGTSPYYVNARSFRSITRSGVAIYEMISNWVWLHKDVASFYIGHAAYSNAISVSPNIAFDATIGAQITPATPLGITSPNFIVSAPGGSYFRRGFMATGRFADNGYRTVFLLETTTSASALSGATAVTLTSTTDVLENDYIGIELNTVIIGNVRQWFHTRVASVVGTTVNLSSALPADVASGRAVKINRWVSLEGQNVTATAADIASVAATINTNNKYEGRLVWDSTNNRMMRASGRATTSVWYIVDGSGSVTPV